MKNNKYRIIQTIIGLFIILCGFIIILINNFVKEIMPFEATLFFGLIGVVLILFDFRSNRNSQ
jgi:uncharacterized membrane protein